MIKKIKENTDLLLILIVGFTLRISTAINHAFTNDELSAIIRLRYDNLNDLINFGVKEGDMHPAGVQVFEKIWTSIFGISAFSLRLPFVIFGTLAIYFTFKIAATYLNRQIGIWATLLLSLLHFPIIQSELARPYALGLFISTFVAFYLLKIVFDENVKWKHSIMLGIGFAMAMYTHYFLFLTVIVIGFTSLFFINKFNFKFLLLSVFIGSILFLPHIPITLYHLQIGGLGWLGKPDNDFFIQFLFHLFNEDYILIILLTLIVVVTFFTKTPSGIKNSKVFTLILIWSVLIYLVGHVLSLVSTPLLKFPVIIFVSPFILIVVSYLFKSSKIQNYLMPILSSYILYSTILKNELFSIKHQGFRKTAELVVEWNDKYGKEDIYAVYNINNEEYINFYAKQQGALIDFDIDEINYGDENTIRNTLSARKENYCVVGYSEKNTVIQIFEIAKEFYPFIVAKQLFENSTVYLLSKNADDSQVTEPMEQYAQFNAARENGKEWVYKSNQIKKTAENYFVYELKDENIYGPEFIFQPKEIQNVFSEKYFKVNAEIVSTKNAQLTITVSAEKNGVLVQDLNGEIFWMGFDVDEMIACQADSIQCLRTCYFAFELPEFLPQDANVKISFWNRGKVAVGIKSVQIEIKENLWN